MKGEKRVESDLALIDKVRKRQPLIHQITNGVTINDCANITLSCGASPVMADAPEEAADMTRLASALVLNIGTLHRDQVETMIQAGLAANKKGIPVVLDPVGVGATPMRTEAARRLMNRVQITHLKGNAAEIATLAGVQAEVRGVDSGQVGSDLETLAKKAAQIWGVTVTVTGARDWITDGQEQIEVVNGHELMSTVSGTGCMSASVLAAFAATGEDPVASAVSAMATYGVAAEQAARRSRGPGSFRVELFDAIASLTGEQVKEAACVTWRG